jgi:hypothetical protein
VACSPISVTKPMMVLLPVSMPTNLPTVGYSPLLLRPVSSMVACEPETDATQPTSSAPDRAIEWAYCVADASMTDPGRGVFACFFDRPAP